MQRPAAEALVRANRELKPYGYGVIVHDGYRPWYVTKIFWDATPNQQKIFVANPAKGSVHNRGCAVDLSLYDLKTGEEVQMPSGYDEMTKRAYADYPGGTAGERARRALLRRVMEKQGFTVNPEEWWHFDYKDWKQYPILNVKFEDLGSRSGFLLLISGIGVLGGSGSSAERAAASDQHFLKLLGGPLFKDADDAICGTLECGASNVYRHGFESDKRGEK